MRSHNRLPILLGILAMTGPFSIDTIFPAFPEMSQAFRVPPLAMQQSISAYLLAYATMSLFHGPASDAFGRRRVLMIGSMLFSLASVGCATSGSLPELIFFRVLQGLCAGVGLIVGRAIIRDLYKDAAAQKAMSHVSLVFGLGPALAPVLGGWLLGFSQWPSIFWFLAGFGVLSCLISWKLLPESHPAGGRAPFNPRALLSTYRRMLGNRHFVLLVACSSLSFSAFFLYIASAPALVFQHLKLDESQFGWLFIPMVAGLMAGAYVFGLLAGKVPAELQVKAGFALGLLAAAGSFFIATGELPLTPVVLTLPLSLLAFGVALITPIIGLKLLDLYPGSRGATSSLQLSLSLGTNAVIAGLVSPLVSAQLPALTGAAAALLLAGALLWKESQIASLTSPSQG